MTKEELIALIEARLNQLKERMETHSIIGDGRWINWSNRDHELKCLLNSIQGGDATQKLMKRKPIETDSKDSGRSLGHRSK